MRLPPGLGVTAGVGLAIAAVTMVLSHVLLGDATLPVLPLAVVAVVVLIAAAILELRGKGSPVRMLTRAGIATPLDIVAALAALLVLMPILLAGLTFWTAGSADFPSYAASAQIWATSAAEFQQRHPDAFGAFQAMRAANEKPIVTAVLVLASGVSGVAPHHLLTPAMLVFLFALISSLLTLGDRVFRLGPFGTALATLAPTFSILPMSRIFDAQLGQVAAVTFIVCVFAVIVTSRRLSRRRGHQLGPSIIGGFVGAAAIGSNVTLVIGSGLSLMALTLWLLVKHQTPVRDGFWRGGLSAVVAAGLSIPMLGMYWWSLRVQTSGEQGSDLPLASPLAAIGLQSDLHAVGPLNQTLIAWIIVLVALFLIVGVRFAKHRRAGLADGLLLAALVANGLVIALLLGWTNYAMHKWMALMVAVAMPLGLAYVTASLPAMGRRVMRALQAVLVSSSAVLCLGAASAVELRAGRDLFVLQQSPELAQLDDLNIHLGSLYESMIAALVVPPHAVTVVEQTYAPASPPRGNAFLMRAGQADGLRHSALVPLNEAYVLATLDLSAPGIIDFIGNVTARTYLFGNWHASVAEGALSGPGDNYVVLDVPDTLRGKDVHLTITGNTVADGLVVLVNDRPMEHASSENFALDVPAALVEAAAGRLAINFRLGGPLLATGPASDGEQTGFRLTRLNLMARE